MVKNEDGCVVLYGKVVQLIAHSSAAGLLTAHKVVNHRVDGAIEVAQPVGDERGRHRVIVLRQLDRVSVRNKKHVHLHFHLDE